MSAPSRPGVLLGRAMVTPIAPTNGSQIPAQRVVQETSMPARPASESSSSDNDRVRRSVAEAERIIQAEKLTGAKAMRIRGMILEAQQNQERGDSGEAERVAREALQIAQDAQGSPIPGADNGEDPGQSGSAIENEGVVVTAQRNEDGDSFEPQEREITNYKDGSSDSGVSMQYDQPLTPAQAPLAVAAHESSHHRRESREAIINGQRVLQSTRYFYQIDPNSGEIRITGGQARTLVFSKREQPDLNEVREGVHEHLDEIA